MQKIVINKCYGGFSISIDALYKLKSMGNKVALAEPEVGECYSDGSVKTKCIFDSVYLCDIKRNDPDLISIVEEMGDDVNGRYAKLKVVEIPDNIEWEVEEYDGLEWISEKHRTWR